MKNKPSEAFSTRYAAAKKWRDAVRADIEEAFMFCCPGREFDFSRSTRSLSDPESETFSSLPEELATDLAGDLVTYYTPPEATWCDYAVISEVPEDAAEQVSAIVDAHRDEVFNLITSSNYYDIAPQWGFETAVHGTPAIWCDVAHISQPIHFEVVPPHELLIVPGHLGMLDRFRETSVLASSLKALLPGATLDDPELVKKIAKPGAQAKVCWGFWIDWTDPGNPVWKSEITVDGHLVTPRDQVIGPLAGSCPLLVGRFNPMPGKAWGRGPGIKALRELRVSDSLTEGVLDAIDQSLRNTLIYRDDGALDLQKGIVVGTAVPAGRGFDNTQVYDLSRSVNVDQGYLAEERQDEKLRRMFYQDGPRQRADTPPTAAQWLDERRRVQQRIGKPSAPLWSEMILPLIQRVETLAVRLGRLPGEITHDGTSISITPLSPLQKAQNQDKVLISRSNLELGAAVFGETFGQVVDPVATFRNVIKTSGDEITVVAEQQSAPASPPAGPRPPA